MPLKYSSSFYRPEREAQVLRTIIERNDNLVKDKDMAHIFSHSHQQVWLRFDPPYSEYFYAQLPNESSLFSAFSPLENSPNKFGSKKKNRQIN
jgi:hypothetical protein